MQYFCFVPYADRPVVPCRQTPSPPCGLWNDRFSQVPPTQAVKVVGQSQSRGVHHRFGGGGGGGGGCTAGVRVAAPPTCCCRSLDDCPPAARCCCWSCKAYTSACPATNPIMSKIAKLRRGTRIYARRHKDAVGAGLLYCKQKGRGTAAHRESRSRRSFY